MKQIALIILILLLTICAGCSNELALSDKQIDYIWNQYHSKEFYEGFYEKLSSNQRKKIMKEVAEENSIDFAALMLTLQEKSPDKYSVLFY